MKEFNRVANSMPSSGIRKIFEMSQGMSGCIHLEVGQPDFRTPEHILDSIKAAADEGFTRYTANAGILELREALVKKVADKNGMNVDVKNIVVSPGAVCSVYSILLALVEPGDEVLVPDPAWPNYLMQMSCVNARSVRYPLDPKNGFQIDFDALEKCVTAKTKAMIINSPGNPTGAVFSKESIEKVVDFARRHDIFLLSDEVYEDIIFEGEHTNAGVYNDDGRIATVYGFSKSYAVTGLRIGYVVCEEKLAGLITKLQEPLVSCPSSISQKACLAALQGPQDAVDFMVAEYKKRRDAVVNILKANDLYLYTPNGAFYILVDISSTGMKSLDFALDLLKNEKVAVAPGDTFGDQTDSFLRLSFGTNLDQLVEGVTVMCDKINSLRS